MKSRLFLVLSAILHACNAISAPVLEPQLLKQIKWTGTSWFSSPIIHDLGTGDKKLIGTFYDIIVWDENFNEIARAPHGSSYPHKGRIYPPAICADLDNNGTIEIIATTTQTNGGAQVFVFNPDGTPYQPAGITGYTSWPRYNTLTGPGNDADANGSGNSGYGWTGNLEAEPSPSS